MFHAKYHRQVANLFPAKFRDVGKAAEDFGKGIKDSFKKEQ
jgi:hypothetical protein